MLNGLKNFLQFLNDNWTVIVIIIGLAIALTQKVKSYFLKSNDEKIEVAKEQIAEIVLKLITDAEVDYESWNKAGSIKRAQVIQIIFEKYPILAKWTNQQEIINWIDMTIDTALKELRDIVANQSVNLNENK